LLLGVPPDGGANGVNEDLQKHRGLAPSRTWRILGTIPGETLDVEPAIS
jgi:hypothetical protein